MLENKQKTAPAGGKYLAKRKKRKKWLVPLLVILVIAAAVLVPTAIRSGKQQVQLNLADTTVLSYRDLESSISATGTVESAETTTVYSTMAYPVMAVHVKVGDYVEAGQLLAELDGKTLQNQIASQQIGLETAGQSGAQQVHTAQTSYENFKSGLDQGLNATLNGAKTQAETAYDNYIKAKNNYERYAEGLNVGENTSIISAESALRTAQNAYETAQDNLIKAQEALEDARQAESDALEVKNEKEPVYNQEYSELDAKALTLEEELKGLNSQLEALKVIENPTHSDTLEITRLETEIRTKSSDLASVEEEMIRLDMEKNGVLGMGGWQTAYDQAVTAREQAETAVESAWKAIDQAAGALESQQDAYNATLTTVDHTLADYQTAMNTAWKTYQTALTSLAATEKTVQEQLETYANNVTTAQVNSNNAAGQESLRQLEASLEETKITAPCAGTITAVYAEVGGAGSGLLFIIEDVDNLVVDTTVKGYDVGTVQEGMEVVIRSDATGDAKMQGVISSIAPTSRKNTLGMTDTTGEAVFETQVEVTSRDTGLRIGMEAQLDYILARAPHVLAVPYDAVYENAQGQTCILAALEQGDDLYRITEIPVTTGLDDDLDMAVTGEGVQEGLRVIHDPAMYLELLGQTVLGGNVDLHGMAAIVGGMTR